MLRICSVVKLAALQAFAVDAVGFHRGAGDHHVGRHVAGDVHVHAGEAVGTDAHELVDLAEAAQDGPVLDVHVPARVALLAMMMLSPRMQSWAMCT